MTSTGFMDSYQVMRKIGVPAALLSSCEGGPKGLRTAWEPAIPSPLTNQELSGLAGTTRPLILGQLPDSSMPSRIFQPSRQL